MSITLRPYQLKNIECIQKDSAEGSRRLLTIMATGGGKTVVFGSLIKEMNCRALIIAHTRELLSQAEDKIDMIDPNIKVGFLDADHKEFDAQVVISSIQSACRPDNLARLKEQNFPLCIYDEAHRSAADGARNVLSELGFGENSEKLLCGFTATGTRADEKGLAEIFDKITFNYPAKRMIIDGYLVPPVGYKIKIEQDLSKLKSYEGDFCTKKLEKIFNNPKMNELVVKAYLETAAGRPTICFGITVNHSKKLSDLFNQYGVPAELISGAHSVEEREEIFERYNNGTTKILCNAMLLTEGIDLPQTSCIIMARGTKSQVLYTQCVGRGLRLWPNKEDCIVIDFSDKNNSLCDTTVLLNDSDKKAMEDEREKQEQEIINKLPRLLNEKLKMAIVKFNMLGNLFNWKREKDIYSLIGGSKVKLQIEPQESDYKDKYCVVFYDPKGYRYLARDLNFEWAFNTAEDFARRNRKLFAISDKDAVWRNTKISDSQKRVIARKFSAGVDDLTMGQASDIISSGVLFK